jgi:hypothetical protein
VLPWVRAKRKLNTGLTRSVSPHEWPPRRGSRKSATPQPSRGARHNNTSRPPHTKRALLATGRGTRRRCYVQSRQRFTPRRLPRHSRLDAGCVLATHFANAVTAAKERCSLARRLPSGLSYTHCKRRDRRGSAILVFEAFCYSIPLDTFCRDAHAHLLGWMRIGSLKMTLVVDTSRITRLQHKAHTS